MSSKPPYCALSLECVFANVQLFCFGLVTKFPDCNFYTSVYIVLHREREDQIQKLSEAQKQQAQHAEHALEDFKSQVERNSGRMFDEMKAQVDASIVVQLTSKELAKFEY